MNEKIDDTLRKYVERVQSYSDQLQRWDEDEVKGYLVEVLLTDLNWDPTDRNFVRRNYPVTMGSETKKADYVLMSGDTPICVVEAKAGELDEAAARQALSYARNLNAPWTLVTNGQKLCLYGIDFYKPENVMNALVMDIVISPDSIDASLDSLRYLAKGTLDSEDVHNVFKTFNERRALLVFLQWKKESIVKVVAKWIEEHWDKGIVDETSLLSSLETVFGRVERIEEKPAEPKTLSSRFTTTVASDWKYRGDLGKGIFEMKTDTTKRIDLSGSIKDLERQLEKLGLRTSTRHAIGGFRHTLRKEANII